MSVLATMLAQARSVLEVAPGADKAALKRAYRRKAVEHSPDQDPEGFRQVREAYDLLGNPIPAARRILSSPMPHIAPPVVPGPTAPSEPLALSTLRLVLASLSAELVEQHLSLTKPGKPKSP
jgi:hypothetical protein